MSLSEWRNLGALALAICMACGDSETTGNADGSTGEDTTETPTSGGGGTPTGDQTSSGSTVDTSSGATSSDTEAGPVPARFIRIAAVEANQGTGVAVALDGQEIPVEDRNAPLVRGRDTLLRVFYDISEEEWQPWVDSGREIEGRLTLRYPDGTEKLMPPQVRSIDRDAVAYNLTDVFYWGLPAADVRSEVGFVVELFEVDDALANTPEPDPPPRFPGQDWASLGIADEHQRLRVVIVPVQYSYGGCDTLPDTTEETLEVFETSLYQQYPIEDLDLQLREPFEWIYPVDSDENLQVLLQTIAQLRTADAPADDVYYAGVIDSCNTCPGCYGGYGYYATGEPEDAVSRVSISRWRSGAGDTAGTLVHEIGHNHERDHAPCDNPTSDPGYTDADYPHENGVIGTWGFGIVDLELRSPTSRHDFMSYCNPQWVSDYTWAALYERIRTLTSWSEGGGRACARGDARGTLVLALGPGDFQAWWTAPRGTRRIATDRSHRIDFLSGEHVVAREWARVTSVAHGSAVLLQAPLPHDFDDVVTAVALDHGNERELVPLKQIRLLHGPL